MGEGAGVPPHVWKILAKMDRYFWNVVQERFLRCYGVIYFLCTVHYRTFCTICKISRNITPRLNILQVCCLTPYWSNLKFSLVYMKWFCFLLQRIFYHYIILWLYCEIDIPLRSHCPLENVCKNRAKLNPPLGVITLNVALHIN